MPARPIHPGRAAPLGRERAKELNRLEVLRPDVKGFARRAGATGVRPFKLDAKVREIPLQLIVVASAGGLMGMKPARRRDQFFLAAARPCWISE